MYLNTNFKRCLPKYPVWKKLSHEQKVWLTEFLEKTTNNVLTPRYTLSLEGTLYVDWESIGDLWQQIYGPRFEITVFTDGRIYWHFCRSFWDMSPEGNGRDCDANTNDPITGVPEYLVKCFKTFSSMILNPELAEEIK
jgi:hypothetical protein